GDGHDAPVPLRHHAWQHGTDRAIRAVQIDVDDAQPVRLALRREQTAQPEARARDQDVEPAELALGERGQRLHVLAPCDLGADADRAAAIGANPRGHLVRAVAAAGDAPPGPPLREGAHHGAADTAAASRDDDRLRLAHVNFTLTEPSRVNVARTLSAAFTLRIFDTDPVITTSPARSPSPRAPRWLAIHTSELSGLPITSNAVLVATTTPLCS